MNNKAAMRPSREHFSNENIRLIFKNEETRCETSSVALHRSWMVELFWIRANKFYCATKKDGNIFVVYAKRLPTLFMLKRS